VRQQLEHGAPQERPQRGRLVGGGAGAEAGDEGVARRPPGRLEEADAATMQRLRGEVAADEAPVRAIRGGVDVAAAGAEQALRLDDRRAVGEGGASVDERAVRQAAVGDEDVRGEEEAERDDGAVPRVQLPEERAQVKDGAPEGQELGQEEQRRRAGREPAVVALTAGR